MSKPLNWGFLGTSFISDVMADAVLAEGSTTLYAVAGRSEAPRTAFAQKYKTENVYTSYDELIADPNVDLVYIALPNHVHHEYVIKAAEAGKAILCEKSLSVDMETTRQALSAVAQHGVFFAEGLMYLHHPLIDDIARTLASGAIGDIRGINAQYTASIAQFVNPDSKGALYNLGCYPASLAHLVLQQAFGDDVFQDAELEAKGRRGADGNICEAAATLKLKNNVMVQLHTAEDYGLHAGFTVLGSTGSLQVLSNPWLPDVEGNQYSVTTYEQPSEVKTVSAQGNGFLYQVRAIREAVEEGKKELVRPAAQPKDSMTIMQLLTDWEAAAAQSC